MNILNQEQKRKQCKTTQENVTGTTKKINIQFDYLEYIIYIFLANYDIV